MARILDVNDTYGRDRSGVQDWMSIVELNADEAAFAGRHARATAENVIHFYLIDADNPTSILSAIGHARENARTLRPLVSTEMWVALNVFYNRLKAIEPRRLAAGNLSRVLTEIKESCQLFTGIAEGTFYRDQAWYFYQLGRYIERADQTTRLLDAKYRLLTKDDGSPGEIGEWHALLRSASGYHAFRRVHSTDLTPARVVGFLLFNPSFPRSVYLCVREIDSALTELRSRHGVRGGNDVAEGIDGLRAILATRSTEEVLDRGLHDFIDFLQRYFIGISNRLASAFFAQPLRREADPPDTALAVSAQMPS